MSRQKLIHLHGTNVPSKETLVDKGFVPGEIAVKNGTSTDSELYVLSSDDKLAVFATKTYLENFAKTEVQRVENALTGLTSGAVATLRTDLDTLSGTVSTLSQTVETNKTQLQGEIDAVEGRMDAAEADIVDLKKIRGEFAAADTALENKLTSGYTDAVAAEAALREQGDAATLNSATGYTDTKVAAEAGLRDAEDKKLQGAITTLDGKVDTKVTELEGKIAAAKDAATTKVVEGTDAGNNMTIVESAGEGGSKVFTVNLTDVASAETLAEVKGQVTKLIGDDAIKSVRAIANEELAAQLIPSGATEALDTLQEIAAWIQEHPEDAAAMNAAISGNTDAIADNADAIATETAERKSEITRVEKLVTGNTSSLQGEIDAVEGRMDTAEDEIDALQSATTANASAITVNANAIERVEREYKAEDTKIRGEFAAEDTKIRGEFAAEDTKIRGEFASADTVTLNSATGYTYEQIAAEALARDNADKALGTRIDGVKTTADSAVQAVAVTSLQGVQAVKGSGNVVTIDCADMIIDCGSWE
jgi:predicted  nucleic acid-binding Zn-ribbon protein